MLLKKTGLWINIFICLVCASVAFSVGSHCEKVEATVSRQAVDEFYYSNRLSLAVERVDPDNYFDYYYTVYPSGGEEYYRRMQDVVTVATCLDTAIKSFNKNDYDQKEWSQIEKRLERLVSDSRITLDFNKNERLENISLESSRILSDFNTKSQKFEIFRDSALNELSSSYGQIVSACLLGNDVYTHASTYDETAKGVADTIYAEFSQRISEVTFSLNTEKENKALIADLKSEALKKFDCIEKNKIERAYNLIMDYYAYSEGLIEGDYQLFNQAMSFSREVVQNYQPILSSAVYEKYSDELDIINNFLTSQTEFIDYGKKKTSIIQTEDKAVSIMAVEKIGNNEYPCQIFYDDDKVITHQSLSGASKRNAQNALKDISRDLSVAYFVYIDVFRGTNIIQPETISPSGNSVVYRVVIDLNKYYENYVLNDSQADYGLFNDSQFVKSKIVGKSRLENILLLNDYVLKNPKENLSVCYGYSVEDGKSVIQPLNFNIDTDGGILMFETNSLATFAIAQKASENVLLNPLFWLILICAVLVAVLVTVLVLKNITYKYKFFSNSASKPDIVKVKKGDAFCLPESPSKDGFIFGGWYIDKKCSVRFVETRLAQRRSQKVYAKWIESDIPYQYKKYYEALSKEMLCFSKVGPLANLGTTEREIIAKLFADMNGVYMYTAIPFEKAVAQGFEVTEADGEYSGTPTKKVITDKKSFEEAMEIIDFVMAQKGLQNIGYTGDEVIPMTDKEKKEGFVFVIENDRVALSIEDYFNLLRVYMKSYVLRHASSTVKQGAFLTRMYLDKDVINLYLALAPVGVGVENASDKFEDTPALIKVSATPEDINKAYDLIDKVMTSSGFERDNENANGMSLVKPEEGCGVASIVKLENANA